MAETLLLASPAYADEAELPLSVEGRLAWTWPTFSTAVPLYVSPLNPGGVEVMTELLALYPDGIRATDKSPRNAADPTRWLLYLRADTFETAEGERLAAEVEAALLAGVRPAMAYDAEVTPEFGDIIHATPRQLTGLYGALAVEWRRGAHRAVSMRLVARALGATMGGGRWLGLLRKSEEERAATQAAGLWRQLGGGLLSAGAGVSALGTTLSRRLRKTMSSKTPSGKTVSGRSALSVKSGKSESEDEQQQLRTGATARSDVLINSSRAAAKQRSPPSSGRSGRDHPGGGREPATGGQLPGELATAEPLPEGGDSANHATPLVSPLGSPMSSPLASPLTTPKSRSKSARVSFEGQQPPPRPRSGPSDAIGDAQL